MSSLWPGRAVLTVSLFLLSSVALPLMAEPLPPPQGDVLLRVVGDIEHPNVGEELHLDRAMLKSLPQGVIETSTPWTEGVGRFEGPLLRALLEAAGTRSDHVRIRALNEYESEVPVADFHAYDVILALERDGEPIAVRDLGPMFVLYPFDEHPELLNETIRHRSVWHVGSVHVP
ncbi:molybdopterin-dependent oxidoreductase [Halomonas sp. MCCC 1A17488]|uniref:Molybdopterin-dependent oxidoreductase n=1 Tax=Billgrantia sulfidoxydans TaxID=2733484 RepID=A0ABX7WAR1_9GAMM|nr:MULTISPECIES: molybdopterin-dependent oxidoreductase [Halomonas]MCE8017521.1 molybdopterin-dependent oxidoreductase [Halomonas sp. MCCC 1A17488]MCG3240854.1 molybdopterin-dependent oxidoreductase [Halomonas sp. MCCC 1A17488]QPP48730.1 molybdopterin-dependent oxidoreductase [Halomonas sp. SS10-MC5]QTP56069.1 molybdopterin-dependent oxidoreductase [Halomonas sulfidoxydans]